MTDAKMITLDTIQLNRQKLNFQSYPKPKKQFVCLYGTIMIYISVQFIANISNIICLKSLCFSFHSKTNAYTERYIQYLFSTYSTGRGLLP